MSGPEALARARFAATRGLHSRRFSAPASIYPHPLPSAEIAAPKGAVRGVPQAAKVVACLSQPARVARATPSRLRCGHQFLQHHSSGKVPKPKSALTPVGRALPGELFPASPTQPVTLLRSRVSFVACRGAGPAWQGDRGESQRRERPAGECGFPGRGRGTWGVMRPRGGPLGSPPRSHPPS